MILRIVSTYFVVYELIWLFVAFVELLGTVSDFILVVYEPYFGCFCGYLFWLFLLPFGLVVCGNNE